MLSYYSCGHTQTDPSTHSRYGVTETHPVCNIWGHQNKPPYKCSIQGHQDSLDFYSLVSNRQAQLLILDSGSQLTIHPTRFYSWGHRHAQRLKLAPRSHRLTRLLFPGVKQTHPATTSRSVVTKTHPTSISWGHSDTSSYYSLGRVTETPTSSFYSLGSHRLVQLLGSHRLAQLLF